MEPNKCDEWKWVRWEALRAGATEYMPMFLPLESLVKSGYPQHHGSLG